MSLTPASKLEDFKPPEVTYPAQTSYDALDLLQEGAQSSFQDRTQSTNWNNWGSGTDWSYDIYDKVAMPVKPEQPKEIAWKEDLYLAYEQALKEKKPLIVEFSTPWCDHCKHLNDSTLKSPEVKAMSDKAVWARIDPEKDDANHNVSNMLKSLKIDAYPTCVVLDVSDTQVIERGRIVGYYDTKKFTEQMNKLLPEGPKVVKPEATQFAEG